jgi:hypothetical protein
MRKIVSCKKCNGDFITQTTSISYDVSWLNCVKCGFKSQNKNDFIKEIEEA